MELYYETSLSAYILLQEVKKELDIRETPEESLKNGNYKKIIKRCYKVIEERYPDLKNQERLKHYISNIFQK